MATFSVNRQTANTISATTYLNILYYSAVTKSVMDTLISNNELEVGKFYIITDADSTLYSGGTSVILQAISYSGLSLQGHGIFYTPKYDQTTPGFGIWTSGQVVVTEMYKFDTPNVETLPPTEIVPSTLEWSTTGIAQPNTLLGSGFKVLVRIDGYQAQIVRVMSYGSGYRNRVLYEEIPANGVPYPYYVYGSESVIIKGSQIGGIDGADDISFLNLCADNTSGGTYSIGSTVIWGGKIWANLTGNIGYSVDSFTLNSEDWEVVEFNSTDYNVSVDQISYDYSNDKIIYRKDSLGNEVSTTASDISNYNNNYYGIHPIRSFQWGNFGTASNPEWGNWGVWDNQVIGGIMECINFRGTGIYLNNLKSSDFVGNVFEATLDETLSPYYPFLSLFAGNTLEFSPYSNNVCLGLGAIGGNKLFNSAISVNNMLNSIIEGNDLNSGSISLNNFNILKASQIIIFV